MDKPAFEIRNMATGHVYKIWADGQIEGFPTGHAVINRIPQMMGEFSASMIRADREAQDPPREDV